MLPHVSFIVCTYNSKVLVAKCLDSIIKQRYKGKIEIILVDGGSDKKTLSLLNKYKNKYNFIRILNNKKRLPEGYGNGKWLGWKQVKGDFVAIVDQDNELQGINWINDMIEPFSDKEIFGCACKLMVDKRDNLTNRYVALQGTDPFFAYRSLDGIINLKKLGEDKGNYTVFENNINNLIITGGNCFVYRKKYLDKLGGYTQDTENILKIIKSGYNKIAIPKNAYTHHMAVKGFSDFIKKKIKWAKSYKGKSNFSYFPKNANGRFKFILNVLFSIIILPYFIIGFIKFIKTKEKAWLLNGWMQFITFFIYFLFTFIRRII
ncbi:MAG: glycosyltransferase family 2 protein [archaeon]